MTDIIFEPTRHLLPKVAPRQNDWWRGAVIYQVYPRSFQDSNGDGVGDLPGLLRRLPYIAQLGVDAVWISPFFTSPMKDFGYDVADYTGVDPLFGTLADFDAVIKESHRLGLKVLIDFVPSHTSSQHPWFIESRADRTNPKADWYVWADAKDDGTPPNNWLSIFGGPAWEWEPRRNQYYLHNFLKEQPDLNFHNPAVVDALLQAAQFWLDRGVDGFRVDAIDFGVHDLQLRNNPPRPKGAGQIWDGGNPFNMQIPLYNKGRPELCDLFLKPLYRLTEKYDGKVLLGEISGDRALERLADYTNGGGFDLCYSFDLMGCAPTPAGIRAVIERQESVLDQGWACWSFDNHDMARAVNRFAAHWGDSPHWGLFINVLLTTLRGTVCLYQGDELGLPQANIAYEDLRDPYGITFWPDYEGRDGNRTPMPWRSKATYAGFSTAKPWLPISPDHRPLAVDRQKSDPQSVLNSVRRFLAWRKAQPALVRGAIEFAETQIDSVLAFTRKWENTQIAVYLNFSSKTAAMTPRHSLVTLPVPGMRGTVAADLLMLPGHSFFIGEVA